MVFKHLCVLALWMKVASALEGLIIGWSYPLIPDCVGAYTCRIHNYRFSLSNPAHKTTPEDVFILAWMKKKLVFSHLRL